jgi:DNA-binding PadR family transcriptional regulator
VLAALLANAGRWSHGYDLARCAGIRSGTLYPLLIRLEEGGFLEAEWQPPVERGRPPRHAYRLNEAGLTLARDNPPATAGSIAGGREAKA